MQNTETTTRKLLGFDVDWFRLVEYLKNTKSCSEVYLYTGINKEDIKVKNQFHLLSQISCCTVRSKEVFLYRNRVKNVDFKCPKCSSISNVEINKGYNSKSNCDVELSVDLFDKSNPETEIFIFTGDGDFEYLLRKSLEKGVSKIYIYSYAIKVSDSGIISSRFSTKLRKLISENTSKVFYVSINDIKDKISNVDSKGKGPA